MCMQIDYSLEENLRKCIDYYGDDSDYSRPVEQMRAMTLRTVRSADVERAAKPFLLKWGRMGRVVCRIDQWERRVAEGICSRAEVLEKFRGRNLEAREVDLTECRSDIEGLYASFKGVVKQTAATKLLHLICPDFMPMWDTAIEQAFRAEYGARAEDGRRVKPFSDTEYFLYVQEVQRFLRTHRKTISCLSRKYKRGRLRLVDQCFIWAVRRPLFVFLKYGT